MSERDGVAGEFYSCLSSSQWKRGSNEHSSNNTWEWGTTNYFFIIGMFNNTRVVQLKGVSDFSILSN